MYDPIKTRVTPGRYSGEGPVVHNHELPGQEALLAYRLVERWGMVAGMDDGEDSAGRHRIRLATPEELVERACRVTELLYTEFRTRGWMTQVPLPLVEAEDKAESA